MIHTGRGGISRRQSSRVVLTQSLPVIRYPGGIISRLQDEIDVTDVNSLKLIMRGPHPKSSTLGVCGQQEVGE